MASARESMSSVDLAWLRMERATNPMMVVGVLTFANRLKYDALRNVLSTRLLRFERFRQAPAHDAFGSHWRTDPQFDLDSHLHRLALPPRATWRAHRSIRGARCGRCISSSAIARAAP